MVPMDSFQIFTKKEIDNYAKVMLWGLEKAKKKEFNKNAFIDIKFDYEGLPLAESIYINMIKQGFNPSLKQLSTPSMEKAFFNYGNDDQLKSVSPGFLENISNIEGSITIIAPSSLNHLSDINSSRLSIFSKSRAMFKNILAKRENLGDFSWSLCMFPTKALADAANVNIEEYAKRISDACFLNEDDPVKHWSDLSFRCDKIKEKLLSLEIDTFHIESENTDLYIKNGDQRKWLGISGRNIPSFEIFISPDYRNTNGTYFANQPSYRSGNIIEGIKLEFKDGKIISACANKGEEYLLKTIDTDEGARRIGEFSMTDKKFSRIDSFMANTLYDENYGGEFGNTHIALGASYSNSFIGNPKEFDSKMKDDLGFNQSAIHWDIVNTEQKTITALLKTGKEKIIYRDGEFFI